MMTSIIAIKPRIEIETQDDKPLRVLDLSCLDVATSRSPECSSLMARQIDQEALIEQIVDIIAAYRISGPTDRYKDGMRPKMLDTVRTFVTKGEPINMLVPAYPFKSPNHEAKVLGPLPDIGERMSLEHFNSIGARIQRIYPKGAQVTIVSDGLCYNDLLGVSDKEVFNYTKGLHRIAESRGLEHLRFTDIFELIGNEPSPTTAEEYSYCIGQLKERLFASFRPSGYNFDENIKQDKNALSTYRGYIKFLESDLATFFSESGMSKSAIKKYSSKVARGMIERGKAFSTLVDSKSPVHVRLSIHASDNTRKLSVTLLPHERYSSFPVTPWHNTPYLDVTNVSLNLGRKPINGDVKYKVCKDELGLEFLAADVPMYDVVGTHEATAVDQQVQLEPLYPCGLKVQVPQETPLTHFSISSVIELAKLHSPVMIEGLDLPLYAGDIINDFHRIAKDGLSLSILRNGTATSTSVSMAASYIVQISAQQDTALANEEMGARYEGGPLSMMKSFGKSLQAVESIWQGCRSVSRYPSYPSCKTIWAAWPHAMVI